MGTLVGLTVHYKLKRLADIRYRKLKTEGQLYNNIMELDGVGGRSVGR